MNEDSNSAKSEKNEVSDESSMEKLLSDITDRRVRVSEDTISYTFLHLHSISHTISIADLPDFPDFIHSSWLKNEILIATAFE